MKPLFPPTAALAAALMLGLAACSEPSTPAGTGSAAPSDSSQTVAPPAANDAAADPTPVPAEQLPETKSPAETFEIATVKAQAEYDTAVEKCGALRSQRGKDKCKDAAAAAFERSVSAAEAALDNGLQASGTDEMQQSDAPATDSAEPPKE